MLVSELEFVKNALQEDLGRRDLFCDIANVILGEKQANANIIAKESGILSGVKYAMILLELLGLDSTFYIADSDCFNKGEVIAMISGKYTEILKAERVLLNILQHSSGIATNVASYVKILRDNNIDVLLLDTRKTRPMLRDLEKYSVLNGGGSNHRFGLDDCLMLKDTHLAHIDDLDLFIRHARRHIPWTCKIEVECDSIDTAKIVMKSGCDIIMCDNMQIDSIKEVVAYRNAHFKHILLEASGNITKDNLISYATSGVDALSSGSLIHNAVWIDLSLKMQG